MVGRRAVIRCRITTGMAKGTPAYRLIAEALNGLASPDEAVFYTSGRTSNEAAFAYQLMVRSYGTTTCPTAPTCAMSRQAPR